MKCPVCTTVNLVMTERQGVEIDYCPDCRGVWLDRGELDKIIERSAPQASATPLQSQQQHVPQQQAYMNGYSSKHGHDDSHGYKSHRKKSFLQELFD
ncbi:MAG: zf-TFIIB domain-containing protein [Desulfuromonadaceae bacterium]|nr:zf-TFIIB domain-containing protein [Desulfuromonadaceae bacterium]MDD2855044.1 zf-TFIIB domain-containing protein [Desulfuromonadaceae bacterium]